MAKKQKTIELTEGEDFTMTALMNHLNSVYKRKKSKELFNMQDIQQYVKRGQLPPDYGGLSIKLIENKKIGLKILRVK